MKSKNKIISAVLLSAGAAAGIALINKYIQVSATSKNLLAQPEPHCFKWRLGNIYYTKSGTGKPLLLIHDLEHTASGFEWDSLLPQLIQKYTVYTIDLLGCGRSEKPNLTYTNFLYVQLLNDFIKLEIGRRTNVIASGDSSSIVTMACSYNSELFEQIMFINPESFHSCGQIPGKTAKFYKFILDFPVIGTLLYHIASSKKIIGETFSKKYVYNPYNVNQAQISKYHEAAHLGHSPKAVYSSVFCNYTKCSINRALEKIDNSIYIIGGEDETGIMDTIREYTNCNPAIEFSTIPTTKHLPHMENPKAVGRVIEMFFN